MVYDFVAALLRPIAWWGRLRVAGLDQVPHGGPLLVVPNHDSQWDPVLVGLAIKPRLRLRFLARASLWRIPGLGPLLYALNQIPSGARRRRSSSARSRAAPSTSASPAAPASG